MFVHYCLILLLINPKDSFIAQGCKRAIDYINTLLAVVVLMYKCPFTIHCRFILQVKVLMASKEMSEQDKDIYFHKAVCRFGFYQFVFKNYGCQLITVMIFEQFEQLFKTTVFS